MGCDIHLFVEKLDGPTSTWGLVAPPNDGWSGKLRQEAEEAGVKYEPSCDYRYAGTRHPDNPAYRVWNDEDAAKPIDFDDDDPPSLAPWFNDRNYDLFAMLANVRNGYGFAGVDTGDAFEPIFMPRGVPESASPEYKREVEGWDCDGHSHSHATVAELRAYFEHTGSRQRMASGCVTPEQYIALRDKGTRPTCWSGGISGRDLITVSASDFDKMERRGLFIKAPEEEKDFMRSSTLINRSEVPREVLDGRGRTAQLIEDTHGKPDMFQVYVRAEWPMTYEAEMGTNFGKLLDELSALGDEDKVRVVFFFDN